MSFLPHGRMEISRNWGTLSIGFSIWKPMTWMMNWAHFRKARKHQCLFYNRPLTQPVSYIVSPFYGESFYWSLLVKKTIHSQGIWIELANRYVNGFDEFSWQKRDRGNLFLFCHSRGKLLYSGGAAAFPRNMLLRRSWSWGAGRISMMVLLGIYQGDGWPNLVNSQFAGENHHSNR